MPKNHLFPGRLPFFIYQSSPGVGEGQVAVLRLHAAVSWGYVMIAPYSPNWASVSLNCSIYYNLLCELPSRPKSGSSTSENSCSTHFGERSSLDLHQGRFVPTF